MLSRRHLLRSVPPLLAAGALSAFVAADVLRGALPPRPPAPATDADTIPRAVVLGFDGIDVAILREYLAKGELPHLAALAREGGFEALESELPPESPVAWASLLTGVNPGRHGIHDFVIPDENFVPGNGMVELRPLRLLFDRIPIRPPSVRSRLAAPTFLERVHAAGYSVLSLKQPHLFPAPDVVGARLLAGLGVPDLSGSAGAYTTWSAAVGYTSGITEFGGRQTPLRAGPVPGRYDTTLEGPPDGTLGKEAGGLRRHATVPVRFEVVGEAADRGVRVTIQGASQVLRPGRPSEFFTARFRLGTVPAIEVAGVVRLEVRRLAPLEIMSDPVQIDPRDPAIPLACPADYAAELAGRYGLFETMGWQEQTFALNDDRQDDEGFLRDALDDLRRGAAMLMGELSRGSRCVFQCFTATDRVSHAFFRLRDPTHHLYGLHDAATAARLGDPILTIYREMDAVVGAVRARLKPEDLLIVCSDHGFQSWRWGLNVNQWLVDEGFLVLRGRVAAKALTGFFSGSVEGLDAIDWSRTKAVALGLGQIFLNVEGKHPKGCVKPEEVPALRSEIAKRLLALRNDYVEGEAPVSRVFFLHDEYHGPFRDEAADLQIGFAPGYRVSWQTALLGGFTGKAVESNDKPWSGDHCSTDPATVLGVVLVNRPLGAAPAARRHHVRDIAATVLAHFHLPTADLDGQPLPLGASR
jgi:predicted AlkP superfamily phosphohydrolase/phosphomutase